MSRIAVPRDLAGNIACSGGGLEASGKPASRLPDKSTAVGWGACGWFHCVFSAAGHGAKLALPSKISINPSINAPPLAFLACRRTPQ